MHPKANKIEIAKAVEKAFSVSVENVNVITKTVTSSRSCQGKEAGYRKAYVTLKEGETIEFFEGV